MKDDGVWTPIGISGQSFKGHFDGNGHTVSGTMTGTTDGLGFFGYTDGATITNLTVDATVSGVASVGGIVGWTSTSTYISNCINKGAVTATGNFVGGITGRLNSTSMISNCTNQGAITSMKGYGGGIAGNTTDSYILGCVNHGEVQGQMSNLGGISGALTSSSSATACYNTGKIARANSTANIGTITGSNSQKSTVNYCQWVLDAANEGLLAYPSGNAGTGTENDVRTDLAALNAAGVTALNNGIAAWNKTNAAGSAKHCPFRFVAGTTAGPTLEAGAPPAPPSTSGGVGSIGDGDAALPQ